MTIQYFFRSATDNTPYDYQSRLAGSDSGTTCNSQLINISTGLGKTAAVVLAWLWNRIAHPDAAHRAKWPRCLVYCLPMRTPPMQSMKAEDEQQKSPCRPQLSPEDQKLVVGGLSIQHEFRPEPLPRNNGEALSNNPATRQSRRKTQNKNGAYHE